MTARTLKRIDQEVAQLDAEHQPDLIKQAAPMGRVNDGEVVVEPTQDDDIPGFLRRGMAAQKAVDDITARAEIEAAQATEKKRKDARRIEKIKIVQEIKDAELTGKRRKMPLAGRAALDALK
jgi:hypothetical protein